MIISKIIFRYQEELDKRQDKLQRQRADKLRKQHEEEQTIMKMNVNSKKKSDICNGATKRDVYANTQNWLINKQNKIFAAQMENMNKETEDLDFIPVLNHDYNDNVIIPKFHVRQNAHLEKIESTKQRVERQMNQFSYQPVLCNKSIAMVNNKRQGHKMNKYDIDFASNGLNSMSHTVQKQKENYYKQPNCSGKATKTHSRKASFGQQIPGQKTNKKSDPEAFNRLCHSKNHMHQNIQVQMPTGKKPNTESILDVDSQCKSQHIEEMQNCKAPSEQLETSAEFDSHVPDRNIVEIETENIPPAMFRRVKLYA